MKNSLLMEMLRAFAPLRLCVKILILSVLCVAGVLQTPSARAQATTLVRPRQFTLLNAALFTTQMATNTNTFFGTQFEPAVWTNTLIPFSGAHMVGITVIIGNTNKFAAGSSNLNLAMYTAMDTSMTPAGVVGVAYGTNFGMNPILTWSVPFGCATQSGYTNQVWTTNIASTVWEPATSLGFTVTNTTLSNITVSLILSPAP